MESKAEESLNNADDQFDDDLAQFKEEIKNQVLPENLVNTKQQLMADEKGEVVDEVIQKVYEWAVDQMQQEKTRLKGLGVEPIDLQVVDMSVLVEGKKKQINRVIFNTLLDFSQVTNILISQSVACPIKPGYQYVNVVTYISGKEIPLIFPYVYKTRIRSQAGKNNLKHWIFINKKFQEAYHLVPTYETIK